MQNKKSGFPGSLYNYLCTILPDLFILTFIKRKQAKSYEEDKQEAPPENSNFRMLQVDFAENFICVAKEVQSAHWKQNPITLFTSVARYRDSTYCEVIIKGNLMHDMTAMVVFVNQLLSKTPDDLTAVNVWSDSLTNQLKNNFVMCSLDKLSGKNKICLHWSFGATRHGKGPSSRVVVTVGKGAVHKIQTRQQDMNNLYDFEKAFSKIRLQK